MMIRWRGKERDLDEMVVLGLLLLTVAIVLMAVIGIIAYELINYESPGSNGIRVVVELCQTLLGILIGLVAGRGMEKRRSVRDDKREGGDDEQV